MPQSGASRKVIPYPGVHVAAGGAGRGGLPPTNLPIPSTPFIGRAALVDDIVRLVINESVRILTLTGPGGVGKTRVAYAACETLLPDFEDGIYFVSLASVVDPDLVVPAIASTLGLKEAGGTSIAATLADFLRDRSMLLLLDNFEQVAQAGPDVTRLLAQAPGVRLIITSRTPLHLYGEYDYSVPPMDLPPEAAGQGAPSLAEMARSEAVQLFIARAKEVQPGFALTAANAQAVTDICRRLDGLPLAMELAAARLRIFSPQSLLKRLDKALPMLVGGARDLPARQRTLRGAIDWSYDLLGEVEQNLFRVVSVFVGGCTLEAVQRVWSATRESRGPIEPATIDDTGRLVERLEVLLDQNLLRRREQEDGEPRFWMLETIREYALEKLSDAGGLQAAQLAHAHFFVELAEAGRETDMKGHLYEIWLPRMDSDNDNFRAALRRSLDRGEAEIALRMAVSLVWFWTPRGYLVEGSRWLEEALAMSNGLPAPLRADGLYLAGWLATSRNDFARTKVFAEESLKLYEELEDKRGIAKALSHLGVVAAEQEDYSLALSRFEQCLAAWRELGHSVNVAMLTGNLCFLALYEGDYERAISYGEESVGIQRALGNSLGIIVTGINLGLALLHAGNYEGGMALHREMLSGAEALGSKKDKALTHTYLGLALLLQGDHEGADPHYRESLTLSEELANRFGVARSLVGLAGVAAGEGDMRQAGLLSGAAHALITATRGKLVPAERKLDERTLKQARKELGEAFFTDALEQGLALTQEQSIAIALRHEPAPAPGKPQPQPPQGPPPEPAQASPGDLTSRELDVLRLIATGLTNREIGERLVLSHRTVEAHLYSIFNKVDVTTRSAATRYALERGLVQRETGHE